MAAKHKAEPASDVELPITPMLDMAFQLLAFFVMTYHPSGFEGQMELNLPASGDAKAASAEMAEPKPSDTELELPSELTVIVKTQQDVNNAGEISQIAVQGLQGDVTVETLAALKNYLKNVRKDLTNQEDIKVQGDGRLKWRFIVEVMDACRSAGFTRVGFSPPPDLAGS